MRYRSRSAGALVLAVLCTACASFPVGPDSGGGAAPRALLDGLLAADRAFSATSARDGLVAGLTAMFAPDVAMAIPGGRFSTSAVEAIDALRAAPDVAGSRAEWVPVRGGISADGLQGYTWGYMTVHKADGTSAPFKYLAYWTKRPEGWRVVAYRRRARPPGEVSLAPVPPSLPARTVAPSTDAAAVERYRTSLDQTERAFSAESQVIGLGVAFARYGRADAVNMGGPNDAGFVVGSEAIGMMVSDGKPAEPSALNWAPDRTIVATSGDLGVTIGIIRQNVPPAAPGAPVFPFFTVWQRADASAPWLYVAE